MLSLTQRPCMLGDKYGGKKRKDEDIRTLKLELKEIEIDRAELNALLGEAHAFEAIYDTSANPVRPYLACIKAIELKSAWEGAVVTLWYEMGQTRVDFKNAKLSKIKIEPRLGAETVMSCTLEGEPTLDKKVVELIDRIGTGIECELRADRPEAQADLPLNTHGAGEQPDTPARSGKSGGRRGRRPGAH